MFEWVWSHTRRRVCGEQLPEEVAGVSGVFVCVCVYRSQLANDGQHLVVFHRP